jgi:MOSC domain-containing protein YiiM
MTGKMQLSVVENLKDLKKLPSVVSINISKGGIPKLPVESVHITFAGLEGDGHNHAKHNPPLQAVCLQDIEKLQELSLPGLYHLKPGQSGENVTVENLAVNSLPVGTVLKFSGGVVLELSKIRKPCYVMDAIHPALKDDALGRHGMYAKVLKEGWMSSGDTVEWVK